MQLSAQSPLRLSPELTQLPHLVAYIDTFAEKHGLNFADTNALTLAAEELFANTIEHSHPPANWVEFSLARADESVIATYADDAPPFDPTLQSESDTKAPVETRRIGGLGIHFIRKSMQNFQYARLGNRNLLLFTRRITR